MPEFADEARKVILAAKGIRSLGIDFDGIRVSARRADAVGPIIDPTAWMQGGQDYRKIADLAGKLREVVDMLDELEAEVAAR